MISDVEHPFMWLVVMDLGVGGMGKGDQRVQNKLSVVEWVNSGDLMDSMVTIANNTLLYTWKSPSSHYKKR